MKEIPQGILRRIREDFKQDEQMKTKQAKEDFKNFVKAKMKKRGRK